MEFAGILSCPYANQKFSSRRYADDTAGVTWGGQTYETPDARVRGKRTVQAVDVSAGVDVQDTEVVLLTFLA